MFLTLVLCGFGNKYEPDPIDSGNFLNPWTCGENIEPLAGSAKKVYKNYFMPYNIDYQDINPIINVN